MSGLASGLQNHLQRFESASDLHKRLTKVGRFFFCDSILRSRTKSDRLIGASTARISLLVPATQLCRRTSPRMYSALLTLRIAVAGIDGIYCSTLRSALRGIPASSGFATHFESASDLQKRLTKVSRFFFCDSILRSRTKGLLGLLELMV